MSQYPSHELTSPELHGLSAEFGQTGGDHYLQHLHDHYPCVANQHAADDTVMVALGSDDANAGRGVMHREPGPERIEWFIERDYGWVFTPFVSVAQARINGGATVHVALRGPKVAAGTVL